MRPRKVNPVPAPTRPARPAGEVDESAAAPADGASPRSGSGPGLVVMLDQALVDLTGLEDHTCGNGRWCKRCRTEIRLEALRWLRELNVVDHGEGGPIEFRPWHRELMLSQPEPLTGDRPATPRGPRRT